VLIATFLLFSIRVPILRAGILKAFFGESPGRLGITLTYALLIAYNDDTGLEDSRVK
jgi:hypothetical protein